MEVTTITSGFMQNNTYLVTDEATRETAVIDPGFRNASLYRALDEGDYKVKYIIATHGHFDHIGEVAKLKQTHGGLVAIHEGDAACLTDSAQSLVPGGREIPPCPPDIVLHGGETLTLGALPLRVYHTPGHSKGGI